MQFFYVRSFQDYPAFEPTMAQPQNPRIIAKLNEAIQNARKLLHEGDVADSSVSEQVQMILDMVATMKRRARTASIPWELFLLFSNIEELTELCPELREFVEDIQATRVQTPSIEARMIPTQWKLDSDGGCQLIDTKRNAVAN